MINGKKERCVTTSLLSLVTILSNNMDIVCNQQNVFYNALYDDNSNHDIEVNRPKQESLNPVTGQNTQGMTDHKGYQQKRRIYDNRMMQKALYKVPLEKENQCPCSATPRIIKPCGGIEGTGRQRFS